MVNNRRVEHNRLQLTEVRITSRMHKELEIRTINRIKVIRIITDSLNLEQVMLHSSLRIRFWMEHSDQPNKNKYINLTSLRWQRLKTRIYFINYIHVLTTSQIPDMYVRQQ